jgi:hypothetical protein
MARPSIYAQPVAQKNLQKTLPSPVGGLNARDSLAAMPATQAIILNNWFPVQYGLRVRRGWNRWYKEIPGTVESLIKYNGPTGAEQLFAAAGGDFIDVTAGGSYDAGDIAASGFSNDRWQYVQFANQVGDFTVAVNGEDTPQFYNGTVWADLTLTSADMSFDPTKLIHVTQMHRRLWFTEVDSTRSWYLPVDQLSGACSLFDLGETFPLGGYLQCAISWSVDTGQGMDDQSVFISSKGNIVIFNGFDPDNAPTDFGLVGVYAIGATIGRRCAVPYSSDVAILCEDGVVMLTGVLSQSKMLMQPPLTDMIQHKLSDDVSNYGSLFGWELLTVQRFNQLYLNVPQPEKLRQYAMNTITGSWGTFTGYNSFCWAKFNEEPFFGAAGYVGHGWHGFVDDADEDGQGLSIQASCLQAFSYFDSPRQKIWNMARPIFTAASEPRAAVFFDVDFEIDENFLPVPPFNSTVEGAMWDVAEWDDALWTGGGASWKRWFSLNNIGFAGAVFIKTATVDDTSWVSTDFVYLEGNIL